MADNFIVNDIVESRFYCTAGNQVSINRVRWEVTAVTGTSVTPTTFASLLAGFFPAAFKDMLPTNARYEGLQVQVIIPIRRPEVTNIGSAGAGTRSGDLMSPQTAGLISFKTAIASRRYRGRMYVPFPAEGDNTTGGKPSAGYDANLATLASAASTEIIAGGGGNTATMTPVIYSSVALLSQPILSYLTRTSWATQRRRSFLRKADVLPF